MRCPDGADDPLQDYTARIRRYAWEVTQRQDVVTYALFWHTSGY